MFIFCLLIYSNSIYNLTILSFTRSIQGDILPLFSAFPNSNVNIFNSKFSKIVSPILIRQFMNKVKIKESNFIQLRNTPLMVNSNNNIDIKDPILANDKDIYSNCKFIDIKCSDKTSFISISTGNVTFNHCIFSNCSFKERSVLFDIGILSNLDISNCEFSNNLFDDSKMFRYSFSIGNNLSIIGSNFTSNICSNNILCTFQVNKITLKDLFFCSNLAEASIIQVDISPDFFDPSEYNNINNIQMINNTLISNNLSCYNFDLTLRSDDHNNAYFLNIDRVSISNTTIYDDATDNNLYHFFIDIKGENHVEILNCCFDLEPDKWISSQSDKITLSENEQSRFCYIANPIEIEYGMINKIKIKFLIPRSIVEYFF